MRTLRVYTVHTLYLSFFCILLIACGSAPQPVKAPVTKPKVHASVLPEVSPSQVLNAPTGVNRWEPSGIAVTDTIIWVVSDRQGYLAGYQRPVKNEAIPKYSFALHSL